MGSNNTRFYKYIQMHINTLKKQRKHIERDRWCSSMLCVYSTEYKISFTFILWFECENSEQHTDNMGVMIKFRKIKAELFRYAAQESCKCLQIICKHACN